MHNLNDFIIIGKNSLSDCNYIVCLKFWNGLNLQPYIIEILGTLKKTDGK